jgi:hypothetical protein
MRAAVVAVLLAAVASAGDEGVELVYEFGGGEAEAAAKVLARRLKLLGVEGAQAKALEDGKRVAIRLDARDRLEDVRATAARVGHLELRRVVNPDTPGYGRHREDFDAAIARGVEAAKACDIPPESMIREERERWPGGLRWYRNSKPSETLKEGWLLCELDGWGITEAALEEVRVSPNLHDAEAEWWQITFQVRERLRANMAELTSVKGVRLATIIDGDVLIAPAIFSQLRERGIISVKGEREARALAAVLGGGALPSKPKLVEERAIGR